MASLAKTIPPAASTYPVDFMASESGKLVDARKAADLISQHNARKEDHRVNDVLLIHRHSPFSSTSDKAETVLGRSGQPVRHGKERHRSAERSGKPNQRVNLSVKVLEPKFVPRLEHDIGREPHRENAVFTPAGSVSGRWRRTDARESVCATDEANPEQTPTGKVVHVTDEQSCRIRPVRIGRGTGSVTRVPNIVENVTDRESDGICQVILGSSGGECLVFRLPILKGTGNRRRLREWASRWGHCGRLSIRVKESLNAHLGRNGSASKGSTARNSVRGSVEPNLDFPSRL